MFLLSSLLNFNWLVNRDFIRWYKSIFFCWFLSYSCFNFFSFLWNRLLWYCSSGWWWINYPKVKLFFLTQTIFHNFIFCCLFLWLLFNSMWYNRLLNWWIPKSIFTFHLTIVKFFQTLLNIDTFRPNLS